MAYISLDPKLPGMRGLLAFRPAIAPPLLTLMQTVMRSNEGLSMGERELIATYVSTLNDCYNCHQIHGEVAQCFFEDQPDLVQQIKENFKDAPISERQKAILEIAGSVQKGGKFVTENQIEKAKLLGISDLEIHDTVLIASLFCFFNRYIDGLGIQSSDTPDTFKARAKMIAELGYHS